MDYGIVNVDNTSSYGVMVSGREERYTLNNPVPTLYRNICVKGEAYYREKQ